MDNKIRFLYSVYPKKPIKGLLPNGRSVNGPKSLQLTKEEAISCMKFGTVYRRYADNRNERVTTINIDRLHNDTFITEEEWKKKENVKETFQQVEEVKETVAEKEKPVEPVKEEVKSEPVVESVEESKTEEITEDTEEVTENENMDNSEEGLTEDVEEVVEEENETDSRGTVVNTEAEVSTDESPEEDDTKTTLNDFYTKGYSNKKKKRH